MSFNETYVTYVLNWFGCVIRCCWCRKGTSWYFKACGSVRIEACLISTVFLYYMYTCIYIYTVCFMFIYPIWFIHVLFVFGWVILEHALALIQAPDDLLHQSGLWPNLSINFSMLHWILDPFRSRIHWALHEPRDVHAKWEYLKVKIDTKW